MNIETTGFQVMDGETNKPLSRRYHAKSAAEAFCALALAQYPKAYVADVYGSAVPEQQRKIRLGPHVK